MVYEQEHVLCIPEIFMVISSFLEYEEYYKVFECNELLSYIFEKYSQRMCKFPYYRSYYAYYPNKDCIINWKGVNHKKNSLSLVKPYYTEIQFEYNKDNNTIYVNRYKGIHHLDSEICIHKLKSFFHSSVKIVY